MSACRSRCHQATHRASPPPPTHPPRHMQSVSAMRSLSATKAPRRRQSDSLLVVGSRPSDPGRHARLGGGKGLVLAADEVIPLAAHDAGANAAAAAAEEEEEDAHAASAAAGAGEVVVTVMSCAPSRQPSGSGRPLAPPAASPPSHSLAGHGLHHLRVSGEWGGGVGC